MTYVPAADRYERMPYRRTGRSGLMLPTISLGLWNNFGADRPLETNRAIVRRAFDLGVTHFDTAALYVGPYLENAPDLVIGYNAGYRISWDCATGMVAGPVFEDNLKPWSGDHCVDPRLVPGVFFCNRKVDAKEPALIDIAPTALRLFGIEPPPHMDGKPIAGLA